MVTIFVYGTLLDRWLVGRLIGRTPTTYSDTLTGYTKRGLNILLDPDGVVEGVTFEVSKKELALLDDYEGIDSGYYKQIKVTTDNGIEAIAYQRV